MTASPALAVAPEVNISKPLGEAIAAKPVGDDDNAKAESIATRRGIFARLLAMAPDTATFQIDTDTRAEKHYRPWADTIVELRGTYPSNLKDVRNWNGRNGAYRAAVTALMADAFPNEEIREKVKTNIEQYIRPAQLKLAESDAQIKKEMRALGIIKTKEQEKEAKEAADAESSKRDKSREATTNAMKSQTAGKPAAKVANAVAMMASQNEEVFPAVHRIMAAKQILGSTLNRVKPKKADPWNTVEFGEQLKLCADVLAALQKLSNETPLVTEED